MVKKKNIGEEMHKILRGYKKTIDKIAAVR